jgi:hypothetical protein
MIVSEGKENADRNTEVCPFLGLKDDPETALSFSSVHNRCFHARLAESVKLEFQRKYCLGVGHINCGEYNRDRDSSRSYPVRKNVPSLTKQNNKSGVFITIFAVVVAFLTWQVLPRISWGLGPSGQLPGESAPAISTVIGLQIPSNVPVQVHDTPTPTRFVTIVAPVPTQTFTPTIGSSHALETPIGVEYKLVVHRVVAGESIMSIASQYWTTVEAIHAVNYSLQSPVLIGALIVIPINQTDVQGLPVFEAYEVKTDITVRNLAQQLSVDPALLELYNGLGNSESLISGDWVLVPHKGISTP